MNDNDDLKRWTARYASIFCEVGANDKAEALEEIVAVYICDSQRAARDERLSLDDLRDLKIAARLADVLLDSTRREYPEKMKGWRFTKPPQNGVQEFHERIYRMAVRLGFSIAETEAEFPELKSQFDTERAAYARACEALEAQLAQDDELKRHNN